MNMLHKNYISELQNHKNDYLNMPNEHLKKEKKT